MAVKKPQNPLKVNGNSIYPITSVDQVILQNGKRLNTLIQERTSVYAGKKFSILGDSISTFAGYIPDGNIGYYDGTVASVAGVNDTWWKKLLDALDAELLKNDSWGGSCVSTINGADSAGCMTRCENLHTSDTEPDVIIIFMGINDFNMAVPIGSYNGTNNIPTETSTFREAYAVMLNKVLTAYKTSEVWICTLPYCEFTGEKKFPEVNSNNVSLVEWNKVIREMADIFGVKVLEHSKCGMTYQNMDVYMGDYSDGDGIHPNAFGHSLLANNAIRQIDPTVTIRY